MVYGWRAVRREIWSNTKALNFGKETFAYITIIHGNNVLYELSKWNTRLRGNIWFAGRVWLQQNEETRLHGPQLGRFGPGFCLLFSCNGQLQSYTNRNADQHVWMSRQTRYISQIILLLRLYMNSTEISSPAKNDVSYTSFSHSRCWTSNGIYDQLHRR